jgi:hypothetical protein
MPPVVSEAMPAAAGTPAAGDQLQALFEGLNFAELQSQFFSGPETLGALGAQGNATLRDFLGRLKKANADIADIKARNSNKSNGSYPGAEEAEAPLHGGPAREPFDHKGLSPETAKIIEKTEKGIELAKKYMEISSTLAQVDVVSSLVKQTAAAFNNLTKGQ